MNVNRGFTLFEMVVVIVLIGLLAIFFINIFNPATQHYFTLKDKSRLLQESNLIFSQLEQDFLMSDAQMLELRKPQSCAFIIHNDQNVRFAFDSEKSRLYRWQEKPSMLSEFYLNECQMQWYPELNQVRFVMSWKQNAVKVRRDKWFQLYQ